MNIEINGIRSKLIKRLQIGGWDKPLKFFMNSSEFDELIISLRKEVEKGSRFTPPLKYIFNAFESTPYDETKVVIIGQDPYPQLNTADGIAFSCSIKNKPEKSLQYIFKALNATQWDSFDPDLTRWCKQGVLPINTALTTEIGNVGSHYKLWKPFTTQLLDHINHSVSPIFILMGKKAEEWEPLIDKCKRFKVPHPASAAYKGGTWDCKNVFSDVNKELKKRGKTEIIW
jgi:uracil-DNA glycosylase